MEKVRKMYVIKNEYYCSVSNIAILLTKKPYKLDTTLQKIKC